MNCGKIANICDSNPCQNHGTCIQDGTKYYCNCTAGYQGQHCEDFVIPASSNDDILFPAITSNEAGIGSEELYAILGNL